jgi:hypothetical protein
VHDLSIKGNSPKNSVLALDMKWVKLLLCRKQCPRSLKARAVLQHSVAVSTPARGNKCAVHVSVPPHVGKSS